MSRQRRVPYKGWAAPAAGDTIEEIAAAKAGIIKEGRPVVLARQPHHEAERVVLERGGCWECSTALCHPSECLLAGRPYQVRAYN